jgi:hypothetical protein
MTRDHFRRTDQKNQTTRAMDATPSHTSTSASVGQNIIVDQV